MTWPPHTHPPVGAVEADGYTHDDSAEWAADVEGEVTSLRTRTAAVEADLPTRATDAELAAAVASEVAARDAAIAAASTTDRARSNHTGTQPSTSISDFTEAVQDAVAALLGAGSNITLNYDDAGNTLTVTGVGDGTGLDAEAVRDAIGVALVGVGNIAVAVNDALDTITISTTATVNSTDAQLRDRSTHTGTQAISTVNGLQTALDGKADDADITAEAAARVAADDLRLLIADAPELIRDTIAAALAAGTGVTITPSDGADTITIAASASSESALAVFGTGADGDATISTTVSPTRDMFYNNLTITSTGRLKTNAYRIFVKGTLTIASGGKLDHDGDPANVITGGGFSASTNLGTGRGTPGGTGTQTAGTGGGNQSTQNDILAGVGGAGGTGGSGGGGAAGTRGSNNFTAATIPRPINVPAAITGYIPTSANNSGFLGFMGGTGGGGGGGVTAASGGGGGGGGGVLIVAAKAIANSGTISANGGAGGTRSPSAENTGGGGGGGGGLAIVSCMTYSGNAPTANGGAGGAGTGTGTAGAAGGAGSVFQNIWGS